jgi:RND superfamily putative drug exporter
VFVAVRVSLALSGQLAARDVLTLFRGVQVYVTVLVYGAGVDYCLFLIARYREELDAGAAPRAALAEALARVAGPIAASAATVICGIGTLAFSRLDQLHQAGIVIPLALVVALACALTFAAALLRLAGRWAFWPLSVGRSAPPPGRFQRSVTRSALPAVWGRLGAALVRHPGAILVGTAAAMAIPAGYAVAHLGAVEYDPVAELPADAPSAAGTAALRHDFPDGTENPVTLLIADDAVDFRSGSGAAAVAALTDYLRANKDELAVGDVRSLAAPLGVTAAARTALAGVPEEIVRARAAGYYVSRADGHAGHVTRIDVSLAADPLAGDGTAALGRLERAVRAHRPAAQANADQAVARPAALLRDVGEAKRGDERRVRLLASAVVFALLVIVFRKLVVPAYLILTVLFSYLTTLGLTHAAFRLLDGPEFVGLDWRVSIFLFTILIAVGEDYSIFLLTRVREEQARLGPVPGIVAALERTGYVISGCGLVMAGTFACLLSAPLAATKQLGVALAVGVLLDTLVVRSVLVPAFLVAIQNPALGRLGRRMTLASGATNRPRTT